MFSRQVELILTTRVLAPYYPRVESWLAIRRNKSYGQFKGNISSFCELQILPFCKTYNDVAEHSFVMLHLFRNALNLYGFRFHYELIKVGALCYCIVRQTRCEFSFLQRQRTVHHFQSSFR